MVNDTSILYPSLVCSFNTSNIEGTTFKNACLMCVCVCVYTVFLCRDWFADFLEKRFTFLYIHTYRYIYIYIMREEFQSVHLLATEFDHPEVTPCN